MIGPDRKEVEWGKALGKVQDSILDWPWNTMGLNFAAMVYNTYAISVLGFLAQTARTSERTKRAEAAGLRRAALGPGEWATADDLWHLQHLGTPRAFHSLEVMAQAAKLRLLTVDNWGHGGLRAQELFNEIQRAGRQLPFPLRKLWFSEWFRNSITTVLLDNERES